MRSELIKLKGLDTKAKRAKQIAVDDYQCILVVDQTDQLCGAKKRGAHTHTQNHCGSDDFSVCQAGGGGGTRSVRATKK